MGIMGESVHGKVFLRGPKFPNILYVAYRLQKDRGVIMAQVIKRPIPAVVKQVAKPVSLFKTTGKPIVKQAEGFQVVSIDTIEFLASGRGGGKPMNPAVAKLIEKALTLEIGQGIKVPVSLRVQRNITGQNGVTSELHTYQGAQSLSKKSKANDMRFRTRRDTNNNLWLFRVEPLEVVEVAVEEEG